MANSIDQLNYYDDLVRRESLKMSEEWISQLSSFIDVLNGYLQPYGMLIPQVTTAQRSEIQSPVLGQMIYNTDTNEVQVWQIKAATPLWRVVTTVP
jgi:hypothetical protein